MNHDCAHCLDYVKGKCPKSCFRAELTEDLKKNIFAPRFTTWTHFAGTDECPLQGVEVISDADNGEKAKDNLC